MDRVIKKKFAYDDDRVRIYAGDHVMFSYGIPPIRVIGKVIERNGRLYARTPGHSPAECALTKLREYVGGFWKWTV